MDNTRKQIIIKEIGYWKEHHLLPEQYCDFLLALYTEGNVSRNKIYSMGKMDKISLGLLLVLVVPFFIYFTELSLILQIVFSIIFLFSGTYLTLHLLKKGFFYQIPLIMSAIILLFASVEICQKIYSNHILSLYGVLLLNCLIWLIGGIRFKFLYFTISGILGMILLGVTYVSRMM
nr:hypothetical protein [uncultured Bacillus sp.]